MDVTAQRPLLPQIGMLATVRNRRGVVSGVRPFDGPGGRLHLVDIEYNDGEAPLEESLIWEREPAGRLLQATALPDVASSRPMDGEELQAMIRACRWLAQMPYVDPDAAGPLERLPIAAPFHGAIQVEDFQLVPLLKALRMPRVSLLIADDVGLGKTIEAGLILSELLLRRRIRRVLILTPAALRTQWRDELRDKFSLTFEIVDRDSTAALRRQLGLDANPWRAHPRIIASYHYLKQADVLEEFRAASRSERPGASLPWDLLIVDEVHNLVPLPIGEDSEVCKMLRQVAPLFEHRLFLTATPHNGHTRSFTGLLEMLDPVRFSQTNELKPAERTRIPDVLIRRLKSEINARTKPPRFCDRLTPVALPLDLTGGEQRLAAAFEFFRARLRAAVAAAGRRRRLAGNFAIEILGKRRLSGPIAFADSWWRCRRGLAETEAASDREVLAAQATVAEETADDREAESRARAASTAVGSWLRAFAGELEAELAAIDDALADLALDQGAVERGAPAPAADSRCGALRQLVTERLRGPVDWLPGERLIVFTEYKTTLDYLVGRLRAEWGDERVLCLYGGMDEAERDAIKAAFNDPAAPVRILVATDAASEGLNLQKTARYLLHWDVPWNPARLEQRNGRLDRHGQARDVQTWHFATADDLDLAFLDRVVAKVHNIREDLGATGEVFDELVERRLVRGEDAGTVQRELDRRADEVRETAEALPRDDQVTTAEGAADGQLAGERLTALAAELDLSPDSLRSTLDVALGVNFGRPRLEALDDGRRYRLRAPHPPTWTALIDDVLRLPVKGAETGKIRALAFDPSVFVADIGGCPIFRPRLDTSLLHLSHPVIRRALLSLSRRRFPGSGGEVSRWTVRRARLPGDCDALLLLTVEELAVNELREPFHHWLRTLRLPVTAGRLGEPLEHLPARQHQNGNGGQRSVASPVDLQQAEDFWEEIEPALREHVGARSQRLTDELRAQLAADGEAATREATERYQSRQGEISKLIESNTLTRLEREIEGLKAARRQGRLAYAAYELEELDRDIEQREAELARRRQHYEEVREELTKERERILGEVLPKRHALRGEAQVLPVAVEILLPEGAG